MKLSFAASRRATPLYRAAGERPAMITEGRTSSNEALRFLPGPMISNVKQYIGRTDETAGELEVATAAEPNFNQGDEMKINQQKMVPVDVKTLKIHCKVSDRFTCALTDAEGVEVFDQDDGYVPEFMPGEHYGDYIILDIDIDTGVITNWAKPSASEIEAFINPKDD